MILGAMAPAGSIPEAPLSPNDHGADIGATPHQDGLVGSMISAEMSIA
jgi:hypothetical protein